MHIVDALLIAVKNIATHGDTDIFPFPFEYHLFFDEPDKCVATLQELHNNFEEYISTYPTEMIETLSQVGYTGFRLAAQIEPFWNAYYLACVISLAEDIEFTRLPEDAETVFSYRFQWQDETGKLFNDSTWRDYKNRCINLSRQ